jgi:hypothetical protein
MGKVLVNAADITHVQPLSKIYMLQLMYQLLQAYIKTLVWDYVCLERWYTESYDR